MGWQTYQGLKGSVDIPERERVPKPGGGARNMSGQVQEGGAMGVDTLTWAATGKR